MGDVTRGKVVIEDPAVINVGGRENVNDIMEILVGTIQLDFPSCAVGAIVSASAAVAAMQVANKIGSRWHVHLMASSWAAGGNADVPLATAIANGIQATARTLSTAAVDLGATDFYYLAIRERQQIA